MADERILLLKLITDLNQPVQSVDDLRKRISTLTKGLKEIPKEGTPAFEKLARTISGELNVSLDVARSKITDFTKKATT